MSQANRGSSLCLVCMWIRSPNSENLKARGRSHATPFSAELREEHIQYNRPITDACFCHSWKNPKSACCVSHKISRSLWAGAKLMHRRRQDADTAQYQLLPSWTPHQHVRVAVVSTLRHRCRSRRGRRKGNGRASVRISTYVQGQGFRKWRHCGARFCHGMRHPHIAVLSQFNFEIHLTSSNFEQCTVVCD